MAVDLLRPWILLLILPLAAGAWLVAGRAGGRSRSGLPSSPLAARVLTLALVLGALAGPGYYKGSPRRAVAFVLDRSASVAADGAAMEAFVREAVRGLGPDDTVAVVAVGERAVVALPPAHRLPEAPLDLPDPGADFSDLAAGLRVAGGLLPDGAGRQVILVTDGRETSGSAAAEAAALAARGIRVDVVPVGVPREPDVRVDAFTAPDPIYTGEALPVTLTIQASHRTRAMVRIYAGRDLVHEQPLELHTGANALALRLNPPDAGVHTYRAVVEAEGDLVSQNDQAAAVVRVLGPPRILLLEGSPADGEALSAALAAAGWPVERQAAATLPATATDLLAWGAVILANVPASDLTEPQMLALESYVRDFGGSLAMVGGEQAFGLGAWHDTPVERALPVTMLVRGQGELPSVGLVLVIDRSASMASGNPPKLELAQEGAIRAAELLGEQDQVGVVGFEAEAGWVWELGPVTDPVRIGNAIGGLSPQGGTNLQAGLVLAERGLAGLDVQIKHIIALTDGLSGFGGDWEGLARRLKAAQISLSTVAVGADSDRVLLQELAKHGGGRFYYTDEPATIPRILAQETLASARSYMVETAFRPRHAGSSPLLMGLESPPVLQGYVATTLRPAAELVLAAPGDDPVLAVWQYGLGRAAVWTSDLKGRWAGQWVSTPAMEHLAANLASWLTPGSAGHLRIATAQRGGVGSVTVTRALPAGAAGEAGQPLQAVVEGPGGQLPVELLPIGPGRYRGEFPARAAGVYLVRLEGGPPAAPAGLVVPYSPEYRRMGRDEDALRAVAAAGGGELLSAPAGALRADLPITGARTDLSPWLLVAALLMLPLEIAIRRGLPARLWAIARARLATWRARRGREPAVAQGGRPEWQPAAESPSPPEPEADGGGPDADPVAALLSAKRRRKVL